MREYKGNDAIFLAACHLARTPATRRQYTKFSRQQRGLAYQMKAAALKSIPNK